LYCFLFACEERRQGCRNGIDISLQLATEKNPTLSMGNVSYIMT
jgi:hypothetical protein